METLILRNSPKATVDKVANIATQEDRDQVLDLMDSAEALHDVLCRKVLTGSYIEGQIEQADYVIVIAQGDDIYGLETLEIREGALEIGVLCSNTQADIKLGTYMLNLATLLAQKHRIPKLRLDAVESTSKQQETRGFKAVGECDPENKCIMERAVLLPPTQGMGRLRLKTLRRSHNKAKKWDAVFEKPDGSTKTVPFGQKGYSDFTKHKDKTRRQRQIDRHARMGENWKDPTTPGALSRYILWNKPSLKGSLRDFKRRFHV